MALFIFFFFQSVDYVKHLLRTRLEMKEDVEDLKTMVKLNVERGELLILQWEEKVNAKLPERERQRVLEQSQGEDEGEEDEDLNEAHGRKSSISTSSLNQTKKRKMSAIKNGEKPKPGKLNPKLSSRPSLHIPPPTSTLPSQVDSAFLNPSPSIIQEGALRSAPPQADHISSSSHDLMEGLGSYRHHLPAYQALPPFHHPPHQASDPNSSPAQAQGLYHKDFLGNEFGSFQSSPYPTPSFSIPSNLLAASMGLSFAAGSAFHYYQMNQPQPTQPVHPHPSDLPTYPDLQICLRETGAQLSSECRMMFHDRLKLIEHRLGPQAHHHLSAFRAGLNTVSLASIIFVIIILLRPDFLLSFIGPHPRSDRDQSPRTPFRAPSASEDRIQDQISTTDDDEDDDLILESSDSTSILGLNPQAPIHTTRAQYESLMQITDAPSTRLGLLIDLSRQSLTILGRQLSHRLGSPDLILCKRSEGRRQRTERIRQVMLWMRIAEIETLLGMLLFFFFWIIIHVLGNH